MSANLKALSESRRSKASILPKQISSVSNAALSSLSDSDLAFKFKLKMRLLMTVVGSTQLDAAAWYTRRMWALRGS